MLLDQCQPQAAVAQRTRQRKACQATTYDEDVEVTDWHGVDPEKGRAATAPSPNAATGHDDGQYR
jgi:hypothetical protein